LNEARRVDRLDGQSIHVQEATFPPSSTVRTRWRRTLSTAVGSA
jgi:hypothetical protein